jgi:hypothetical protein
MAIPSCYANPHPIFQRAMRLVTNITNAVNASVTTSFAHNYETGDIVRLYVPQGWGMVQANTLQGTIVVTSPTTFTIDINTLDFDVFVTPPNDPVLHIDACPHVVPVGEVNNKLTSATQNVLP